MFGSPTNRTHSAPADEAVVREVARTAAAELSHRLSEGQQLTGNWSNRPLCDAIVDSALATCLRQLASTGCWGQANELPSGELWHAAGKWLERGALQDRARSKPRGYAGDYLMLEQICRWELCDDPLGRSFDRYFQDLGAPHAVRSRTMQTTAALVAARLAAPDRPFHAVSVGSGPALDFAAALVALPAELRDRMQVSLIDVDPEALEHAAQKLAPLVSVDRLHLVRENLFRLHQRPRVFEALPPADFLSCAGLFDYLGDSDAGRMLSLFWRQLADGGQLMVGNFAAHNPTRTYMEWIGNWYLTYRTEDDLWRLVDEAGLPGPAFDVHTEQLGIQLFWLGRRND